jgi:hypothetical protein
MFYFYCKLYNTRATAVLSSTTFCPVFTDFSASFLTTSWKMPKKQPKKIFIKKLFLFLLMIRSKLSLSKKLANSMILANDLCQPSVEQWSNGKDRGLATEWLRVQTPDTVWCKQLLLKLLHWKKMK